MTDAEVPGGLTKLTVNIIPEARESLAAAADRCGDSRTDTVSRALILYDVITRLAVIPRLAAGPRHYAEVELIPGVTHLIVVKRRRWWHWKPAAAIVADHTGGTR